jgi:acylphosphatase
MVALLSVVAADVPSEDDKEWATVKGQVVFAGAPLPEPREIKVKPDVTLRGEEWVIDKESKGVRWVQVWLAPEPGAKQPLPIHPSLRQIKEKEIVIEIGQQAFVPHALAIREGQDLVLKNSSAEADAVSWTGHPARNRGDVVAVKPMESQTLRGLPADLRTPIVLSSACHAWMKGWVRVLDHPYFAITDAKGHFEIKHAPAGTWRLFVWHEEIGWRTGSAGKNGEVVTLKGGAVNDLGKLELKPGSAPAARMVYYTGKVQGVGFRATAAEIAKDHPVTGWVKNLDDGRVQLLVEATGDAVEAFLKAIRARWKDNIEKETSEVQAVSGKYKDFRVAR